MPFVYFSNILYLGFSLPAVCKYGNCRLSSAELIIPPSLINFPICSAFVGSLSTIVIKVLNFRDLAIIEIAMVLARGTKLSIFDEPEAGIDLWSFQNLIRVFEKMYEQTRGSILIISHQERILNIADKIVVIKNGQVEKEGARADILPALLGSADAGSQACSVLADKVEGVRK